MESQITGLQCPRCGKNKLESEMVKNSLSIIDNKTMICNDCGVDESMVHAGLGSPIMNMQDAVFGERLQK